MKTQTLEYVCDNTHSVGYIARPEQEKKLPTVLIFHDWTGCNDFAKQKAERLAGLGYCGFAVDMYGHGKLGNTTDEKSALMTPLIENRKQLAKRAIAALEIISQQEFVDRKKIAAIGFCFGGLCALDLARTGVDILGVVSFHGLLSPANIIYSEPMKAKILALHGYADPMVTPEKLLAFAKEMDQAKVDWQVHAYGHVYHAFTNPKANDPNLGLVYNPAAERRSWQAMQNFLQEIFG